MTHKYIWLTSRPPPGIKLPRPRNHEIRPLVLPYRVAVGVAVRVAVGVVTLGELAARQGLLGRRRRQDLGCRHFRMHRRSLANAHMQQSIYPSLSLSFTPRSRARYASSSLSLTKWYIGFPRRAVIRNGTTIASRGLGPPLYFTRAS